MSDCGIGVQRFAEWRLGGHRVQLGVVGRGIVRAVSSAGEGDGDEPGEAGEEDVVQAAVAGQLHGGAAIAAHTVSGGAEQP